MCEKTNFKTSNTRIDKCMRNLINQLNMHIKTYACCCGHGRYPMTIVCGYGGDGKVMYRYDLMSGIEIPRTRRFYKRDKDGYYYIPEVINAKRIKNINKS